MLIHYIRKDKTEKSKGKPIGIVIALDEDTFGWSLCNPKDKWNKKLGLEIAKSRAEKLNKNKLLSKLEGYPTFDKVKKPLKYIEQKAKLYFKIGS